MAINVEMEKAVSTLAQSAFDKKGELITILDMEGISSLTDYFLIVSGSNKKMVQSIADEVEDMGVSLGLPIKGVEGYHEGQWVLIDFGDIMCHVFLDAEREFYGLEHLWSDAKIIPFVGV